MFGDLDKYFLVFLAGLVVTYLLTPVVRGAAIRFGVVDLPNERRPHKHPPGRGGGVAMVLCVHAPCLVAVLLPLPGAGGGFCFFWVHECARARLGLLGGGGVV